ncbi:hypothetical protein NC797_08775 [Aquibacillus sp. 3ASR75-11]|uniref:Uncharacterized protein n=1 Tax=Terrihalobacillus insolitus TaxID=2950438 RepID=A0A9X3WR91_9BACI|nr:hypothetical protein [Terrihalobacillus insolitus]MDC3413641.1 hypothetical protein [Terrihalobacillus insolitus]MDC3424602.1 hypothetical protein [Terrihalobacillus insolitus]
MLNQVLLWIGLIAPWFTLFFMKTDSIKRYMPVSVFVSLLLTIIYEIAYTFEWWTLKVYIVPWGFITNVTFVYGIFLIGTIWIFHFTYRNFKVYLITNSIVDAIFAFGFLQLTEWLGVDEFVNLPLWGAYLIMLSLAFIIYFYQRWQEGIFRTN